MGVEDNNIKIPSFFDNISEPDTSGKGGNCDIISIKNTFETPVSHYSAESSAAATAGKDGQINAQNEYAYSGDEKHFPKSIKYIMGNEVSERYSFYAMKAVLQNYLINFMGYSANTSSTINHGFNAGAYFFTVLGAYVADARLGKYKTILFFSIIYSFGGVMLAISAIPGVTGPAPGQRSPWGLILGLSLIALGTGGIKPVVSAFCGDQFGPHQAKLLTNLFQIFYCCVNLGSIFSSIISPILRTNVGYWCAFSVPAFILIVAIIIFLIGNKKYIKRPPQGSVFLMLFKIIFLGISESIQKVKLGEKYDDSYYQDNWVDRAKKKYDPVSVDQVKMVLRVLLIFSVLPFFWALYDQTGSRWNVQANSMNRRIGSITIDPEIINAINPIFILIFVPIFEYCLYRPLKKRNINFSPLRKIGTGMFLSVLAFYIAAFLQLYIDNSPKDSVHLALQLPQYVILTWAEILISITGLEFAYANSPKNMKTVVMAGWLLTVSIGNLFDVFIISSIKASEFALYLIFGSTMFIFIGLFIVIAYHFKPVDPELLESLNNNSNSNNNSNNNNNSTINNENSISDSSSNNLSINDEEFNTQLNSDDISSISESKLKYYDNNFLQSNDKLDTESNSSLNNNNNDNNNNNTTRNRSLRNSSESFKNLEIGDIFN